MLTVLRSWNDPLYHLVAEMRGLQEAPDTILSRAIEIEEQNKQLLEGMEKIVGQVRGFLMLVFLIHERGDLWDEELVPKYLTLCGQDLVILHARRGCIFSEIFFVLYALFICY